MKKKPLHVEIRISGAKPIINVIEKKFDAIITSDDNINSAKFYHSNKLFTKDVSLTASLTLKDVLKLMGEDNVV